jgi:alkylated DNA nucleotide flippase Atl1
MIAPSASQGTVTSVLVKPVRHEPMTSVVAAPVKARSGFIGDCHAQPLGPRQVLIVREESLRGLGVQPWQVRANIALRGLDEAALGSGRVLCVGDDVVIRITHECEVCKVLRDYVPAETFKQLVGRRGSLGVFLEGGTVAVGQSVRVADERYPEVPERIFDRLAWAVERIPLGKVVTYDRLLTLVGASKPYFRVMPTYLKRADSAGLPAHRVLTSAGIITGHLGAQRDRLLAEGVVVTKEGLVDVRAAGWDARALYVQSA